MQVLAAIVAFLITYGGFRLAKFLWYWLLTQAEKELLDFKHRKNGKEKTRKGKT